MKQILIKQAFMFSIAAFSVPGVVAQNEKEKEKEKSKNPQTAQNIIITRTGNTDEKTVIEIKGDKVTINGKDAKDVKDVNVLVNRSNRSAVTGGPGTWNYNFNDGGMSLFTEDANRAMLGVVTEGSDKGVRITSTSKGSAAEKAGLKKGDIITKIGNKKISGTDDVTSAIRAHKPGDKVAVTIMRDGKEQRLNAELGKWRGIESNIISPSRVMPSVPRTEVMPFEYFANRPRLGLSIQDTDDGKGVKVLEVEDESNAAKAGVKEGDIITHFNDNAVNSTDEISRYVRDNREKSSMVLKVLRDGNSRTIEVKTPRKLKTADL
jgi:serine protease Do